MFRGDIFAINQENFNMEIIVKIEFSRLLHTFLGQLFQSKSDYFDLVITDIAMPSRTSATFAEKLMDIRKDIPIIICSGHSSIMDEEKAKALGVSAYILKPVVKSVIARTIRTVLKSRNTLWYFPFFL